MLMATTIVSTVLWIAAIVVLLITTVFFLRRAQSSELPSQKNTFRGLGLFLGFYAGTRILFLLGWYLTYDEASALYEIFWRAAAIVGMVGFIILMIVLETYPLNKRTKYIGTIIGCVLLVISMVWGSGIGSLALAFGLPFMAFYVLAVYLYLVVVGEGEIRNRALQNFLGILILLFGIIFDTNISRDIFNSFAPALAAFLQEVLAPVLVIVGIIIFINPYRKG